jgi:NAD+ kinase
MEQPPARVAVVGADASFRPRVRRVVEDAGATLVDPTAADALVAIGTEAVGEAVRARASPAGSSAAGDARPTVMPVVDDEGAPGSTVLPAVEGLLAAETRRVEHPVLSVVGASGTARAALDVAVVTDEPAQIARYGVERPSGRHVSVRADGVVVATPLGSRGYAAAVGGPQIDADTGLAVVPVAPFSTQKPVWVVDGGVHVGLERGDGAVALVVDGERRSAVEPGETVAVTVTDHVTVAVPTRPSDAAHADRKGSNNP